MADFFDTTGVSYHLQNIIDDARDRLILISPYLKFNERLMQSIEDKNRLKIDMRVVYGKSELSPDQTAWIQELKYVRLSFCANLHAKCYLNENKALITSMNLYEYSQVNNQEMGITVTKAEDTRLYDAVYTEAMRLIRISDEIRLQIEVFPSAEENPAKAESNPSGFCIRCKNAIPLNIAAPYCAECYKTWKQYSNPNYIEKFCTGCGKAHATTINKPACFECFKALR